MLPKKLAIRAPGKVILFGEHAVVHGVPAIAASLGLHTYLSCEDSTIPGVIELDFPDVGLAAAWKIDDLPFTKVPLPTAPDSLDEEVRAKITKLVDAHVKNPLERAAASAFLYMYVHLCTRETGAKRFFVRSTLPIGAGLGSSASFSVCLSACLLLLGGQIKPGSNKREPQEQDLINKWSFMGESLIHGQPSGIDNVVATLGGAVKFQRTAEGNQVETYDDFPALRLLLTDTRIPRMTAELVAGVTRLKQTWPSVVDPILESIAALVQEADQLLKTGGSNPDLDKKIGELADINHGLLVSLGVSHSALEQVRQVTSKLSAGPTKLTGAGGGGCAITIASKNQSVDVQRIREELGMPYRVFETTLGGPGVSYAPLEANLPTDEKQLEQLPWRHW